MDDAEEKARAVDALAAARLRYMRAALVLGGAREPERLPAALVVEAFAAMPEQARPFAEWLRDMADGTEAAPGTGETLSPSAAGRLVPMPTPKSPEWTKREWVEFLVGASSRRGLALMDLEVPAGA